MVKMSLDLSVSGHIYNTMISFTNFLRVLNRVVLKMEKITLKETKKGGGKEEKFKKAD